MPVHPPKWTKLTLSDEVVFRTTRGFVWCGCRYREIALLVPMHPSHLNRSLPLDALNLVFYVPQSVHMAERGSSLEEVSCDQ